MAFYAMLDGKVTLGAMTVRSKHAALGLSNASEVVGTMTEGACTAGKVEVRRGIGQNRLRSRKARYEK